jgi:exoribonuclease R
VVEIVERPAQPIIGRLLHESGVWLVAPEDKRYGQDVMIPKAATGTAKPGQVVVVELTEPPGAVRTARGARAGSSGRDRRPGHGDRNRRAQVRRAA